LANLANAVDRYSVGVGHWDDVLYTLGQADTCLHQRGAERKDLMVEAPTPTTE
jgi:hypothetical protein